jgi:hypothetical protein
VTVLLFYYCYSFHMLAKKSLPKFLPHHHLGQVINIPL